MCPPPKWCRCLASGPQSRTEHIQGPMPPSPVSRSPPSTFLCLALPPTWVSKPTLTLWKTERVSPVCLHSFVVAWLDHGPLYSAVHVEQHSAQLEPAGGLSLLPREDHLRRGRCSQKPAHAPQHTLSGQASTVIPSKMKFMKFRPQCSNSKAVTWWMFLDDHRSISQ